jgi:hypothetical protein
LVDDRPVGFARCRREASKDDVDLVALQHAAHELLVAGVVRLGVVDDELNRPAVDAAGGVDLFGSELDSVHLDHGGGREIAGLVLQHADLDGLLGQGAAADRNGRRSQ